MERRVGVWPKTRLIIYALLRVQMSLVRWASSINAQAQSTRVQTPIAVSRQRPQKE